MRLPIEFSSSVVKRVNMDWDVFHSAIEEAGFKHQKSILNDSVHYHENEAGFGITLVDGPRANLIFPSGPLRGRLFGNTGFSIGSDRDKLEQLAQEVRDSRGGEDGSETGSRGRTGNEVTA